MSASGRLAHDYVVSKYGTPVYADERVVTVTTAPTLLLGNNPRRMAWLICNVGTNGLTISAYADVAVGRGLLVPAGGGTASRTLEEDGEGATYAIYGILPAGSGDVWVYEVIGA
jgi:hypothetical protein